VSENFLYYGDNLRILRDYIKDESVDLIYLDPPFNSKADYNILYNEPGGEPSEAQITAFEDTWHWTIETEGAFADIISFAPERVIEMMRSFRHFIGENDVMAYLTMMCIRLIELKRVLKSTGSLYLHCDPTASHYLKILMDTIFGVENYRSEIVWRRTNAHNKLSRQFGPIHDVILFYSKTKEAKFHPGRTPYTRAYIKQSFPQSDKRGRFRPNELTGAGTRTGLSGKPWRTYDPTKKGRHWAIPGKLMTQLKREVTGLTTQESLDLLDEAGLIIHPASGNLPRYRQYLDTSDGVLYQDIWSYQPGTSGTLYGTEECIDEDVKYLDADDEKLGYQTQKPIGLLERIIRTSTVEGDVVLDPFCGCGTTVTAAQKLQRIWVGIDITHLAINLIKWRMKQMYGLEPKKDYKVVGEPEDLAGAIELASQNRYQFQWWATSLIDARPYGEKKKGADTGIDGYLYYQEAKNNINRAIVSVKSGKTSSKDIRDLGHVVDREKSEIGILITLQAPTKDMLTEAAKKGFYESDKLNKRFSRLQILTVEEILSGKKPETPPTVLAFKKAVSPKQANMSLDLDLEGSTL
jgi:DNA modification methylase